MHNANQKLNYVIPVAVPGLFLTFSDKNITGLHPFNQITWIQCWAGSEKSDIINFERRWEIPV